MSVILTAARNSFFHSIKIGINVLFEPIIEIGSHFIDQLLICRIIKQIVILIKIRLEIVKLTGPRVSEHELIIGISYHSARTVFIEHNYVLSHSLRFPFKKILEACTGLFGIMRILDICNFENSREEIVVTEHLLGYSASLKSSGFLAVPNMEQYRKVDRISLRQMEGEKFIGLAGTKQLRSICNEFCRGLGVRTDISFESDNTSAIKDAVAAGIGVCFWPEFTWGRVERRKIRLLRIVDAPFRRDLLVTLRRNKADNRNTENFYRFLVVYLRKHFRRHR